MTTQQPVQNLSRTAVLFKILSDITVWFKIHKFKILPYIVSVLYSIYIMYSLATDKYVLKVEHGVVQQVYVPDVVICGSTSFEVLRCDLCKTTVRKLGPIIVRIISSPMYQIWGFVQSTVQRLRLTIL